MSRVKEFEATGLAPNGRLYAGDLLAIQDHYADLSNFSQVVGVGTLQVGDTSLLLVKYGTGEFRMTGAVRTDGILRALGGLYAGAFTTAQRDAIAVNLAPYGLIILNTTLGRFQWNSGTDAARVWTDLSGDLSSMPTAGQKAALAGTVGTPADTNRYVTAQGLAAVVGGGVVNVGGAAGGDLAGTFPNPTVKAASNDFALAGDISPASLSADVNDWNPAGLSACSTIRVSATADVTITGIAGGADGRILVIHNTSAKTITLSTENSSSSAVNRIAGTQSISLQPTESCVFDYDVTSARWRCIGRNFGTAVTFLKSYLTSDVVINPPNTFVDGPTLTIPPGIWDIAASFTVAPSASGNLGFTAKLWDGTNIESATETQSSANQPMNLALVGVIIVTVAAVWKVSVACTGSVGTTRILATPVDNASGLTNKASFIKAVRIG